MEKTLFRCPSGLAGGRSVTQRFVRDTMDIAYLLQAGVPAIGSRPLSGPAAHVHHVFQELVAQGHRVFAIARLAEGIVQSSDLSTFVPVPPTALDRGPLRWFERGVRRVQSELRLPYAGLFEAVRFALACRAAAAHVDLLYERMGWLGFGGVLAARWLDVPIVWEVNGDHLDEFESLGIAPRGLQRWLSVAIMRWAAHQVSAVVATGEGWRARFIERWGVPPARVHVVENGSEVVELLSRTELRAFQADGSTAPADGTVRVVYVGGLEPWHGVDVLLRAMARMRSQHVRLWIVGDGRKRAQLEALASQVGIRKRVTFTGHLPISEVARQMARSDIGVAPYCGRVEFSGLKLLDYKAAGLATVASGADGQPRVLEHGRTGWIVPPCDVEALATALDYLVTHPELRREMGQRARLEAEREHSWRHTAERLSELFQEVVLAHRRPSPAPEVGLESR